MSRTLFVHIPKNAGTSISASMLFFPVSKKYMTKKMASVEDLSPLKPMPIMHKHIPYNYLDTSKIGRFDKTFAVVRNPWARMVSLYHYADKISDAVAGTPYYQPQISFNEFIDRMDSFRMSSTYYWNHPYDQWGIQLDWISIGSKVKCDVLRYENLQEDINAYFNKNIALNKDNVGNYNKDYKEYYTKEQQQKVADWFRLDIEYWGFTFESGATRNTWKEIEI